MSQQSFLFDFALCNFFRIEKKAQSLFCKRATESGGCSSSESKIRVDYNNALFNKFLSTFFTCALLKRPPKLLKVTRTNLSIMCIITIVVLLKGRGVAQKRQMEHLRNKCDHLNSYKDSLNIYKKKASTFPESFSFFAFLPSTFHFLFIVKFSHISFSYAKKEICYVTLHTHIHTPYPFKKMCRQVECEIYDRWKMKEKQFSSYFA